MMCLARGTMYTENITGERITIKRCGAERRNSRLVSSGRRAGRGLNFWDLRKQANMQSRFLFAVKDSVGTTATPDGVLVSL